MRIAVANLKGGTGKTTSAVYLAHALAGDGSTLLIDSDPQGSALSWSETAGDLPFPVIALPVTNIHRQIDALAGRYTHTVIDTPPDHTGIVASALRSAGLVLRHDHTDHPRPGPPQRHALPHRRGPGTQRRP